jgi:hypothetical protein
VQVRDQRAASCALLEVPGNGRGTFDWQFAVEVRHQFFLFNRMRRPLHS